MKKPIIGIVPGWDGENKRYTLSSTYTGWVERSGGVPLVLPYTSDKNSLEQMIGLLDGVIFSGGPDIIPEFYGEQTLDCCGVTQLNRDEMERDVFALAVKERKMPTLGICKGCQVINVMMGGTLYQDLEALYPGKVIDHRRPKAGNEAPTLEQLGLFTHAVTLSEGGPLRELVGLSETEVTTYHHQAVKALAPGLTVMATAPDGVIEAFYAPGYPFLWGVQFHPEMFDHDWQMSRLIFERFISSCK